MKLLYLFSISLSIIYFLFAEKSEDKSNVQDSKSDKNMMELPISESDTDKKVSIFTSDTDGENMHGGK
jgi:hypothetical protein